jgi:DNA-binding Lrp family transcriptional regulator
MNLTTKIKTTHALIIAYIADKGKASVRIIADVLNIPKSTIHNHLKSIKKHQKHPESHLWNTPEGEAWLRLFVLSTLYTFGLGCNIGADRLSRYFKQLRIDTHIGISPNSLRKLLREMETVLAEYQTLCEAQIVHQREEPIHITAAADETFFGELLILVMMDLSSGYLLLEDIADDRTFDTWWEKTKPRLEASSNIEIDHLITDRATALIKLATTGAICESGSDLFHPLQSLSRKLGNPLKRRYSSVSKALKKSWKEKDILSLQQDLSETVAIDLEKKKENSLNRNIDEINQLNKEKIKLKEDNERYNETIKSISMDVHAFNIKTSPFKVIIYPNINDFGYQLKVRNCPSLSW